MIRRSVSFLICIFLLACLSPASGEEKAGLVIMVYMTGSDLESCGGAASDDLEEMMRCLPDSPQVRVVAMISGSSTWRLDIPGDETSVYEITGEGLIRVRKGKPRSMGDPETLTDFLTFAESRYPADQYALILWDHGAGPLVGVCFDETFRSGEGMDKLTLNELTSALAGSPFARKKLSFVGFDACLMATLEVAGAMTPFSEYMIASQETEPPCGWNYAFLRELTGREDGEAMGRAIVSAYAESFRDSPRPVTLSCLDLERTEDVCAALGIFFENLETGVTAESYPAYTHVRALSRALGNSTTSCFDLVDLPDLIGMYHTEGLADGSELLRALDSMIVCRYSANIDFVNGISIYYPFDNKARYESGWAAEYSRLDFVAGYQSFVRKISDLFIGEALMNWNSSYQTRLQEEAGTVRLTMPLTPEEMRNIARARLIVVEEIREGVYQQIYVDDRLRRLEDAVSVSYHGEALYLLDESGEILAGPVTYYPVDGGIAVHGNIVYDVDFTLPFGTFRTMDAVRLIYRRAEDGSLSFTDMMVIGDASEGLFLPSGTGIPSLLGLSLVSSGPVGDRESIRSTADYGLLDWIDVDPSRGAPCLAFLPVYGRHNRYAYIRLTDLQGHTAMSEVTQILNPSLISIAPESICEDSDRMVMTLKSADLVSGYGAGIRLVFRLRNRSDQRFVAGAEGAAIDSADVGPVIGDRVVLAPGEEDEILVYLSGESIRRTGVAEARSISVELRADYDDGRSERIQAVIPVSLNTAVFSALGE